MNSLKDWISKESKLLPDFIIGGAMKSGTTTLHNILNQHPGVFIPDDEVHFFDIDNIIEHNDFFSLSNENWTSQSMKKDSKKMWDWYNRKYEGKEHLMLGEDSTTYLTSKTAARRIAVQQKEIKMLFILRQPSIRAYSNYIHLLNSGRAKYSFENTIQYEPYTVLKRSLYKEQLENYYRVLKEKNIKVILFEDLVNETKNTIKEVCSFLKLDFSDLPTNALFTHSNRTNIANNLKLEAYKNTLFKSHGRKKYVNSLPFQLPGGGRSLLRKKIVDKGFSVINPKTAIKRTKINPSTKQFLDEYFSQELEGIDELIGKSAFEKWFS